jgi:hypothetical protein
MGRPHVDNGPTLGYLLVSNVFVSYSASFLSYFALFFIAPSLLLHPCLLFCALHDIFFAPNFFVIISYSRWNPDPLLFLILSLSPSLVCLLQGAQ